LRFGIVDVRCLRKAGLASGGRASQETDRSIGLGFHAPATGEIEMLVRDVFPHDFFAGKTVFVTGGTSGINLAVARNFAALGARIAVCGRSAERMEGALPRIREFGGEVRGYVCDVRDYQALQATFARTVEDLGAIDVLVCGAAGNFHCYAENLSPNGFKTVIDIDLMGSFHACRAAFDHLRKSRGNIIFISAGQAYLTYSGQIHAGAAKAGIDSMMKALALEWGPYGIRSNSIVPGPIQDTGGIGKVSEDVIRDGLLKATALGRLGTGDDIGQAAVFLASPLASYVTGTRIEVDGGVNLEGPAALRMAREAEAPRQFASDFV
jgi:NAD(P)-dependent dehydrogenase (short-subunit alcohol dehydrogenase family)